MKKILFISGSLRTDSVNTKLLRAFEATMPRGIEPVWANVDLPLFNADLEETAFPQGATTLRDQVIASDAIVIATPEYNRGMSGVLKNAIDWASRPSAENAWDGKRILVVSASPSGIAGALALYQVKQSLMHVGADVLSRPEFMLGNAYKKFDERGTLTDDATKQHIQHALEVLL